MSEAIGIMDGAYFISKNELISWISNLLKINLTKVEQLGTGAVYSQLLDIIHPDEVAMHKLNWRARLEWEFVNNFKVLQEGFDKVGIKKYIDISKLVKAKYQDNLEFGQWMKRYFEIKLGKDPKTNYDPVAKRENVVPDFSFIENKIPTKKELDYTNFKFKSVNTKRGSKVADNSSKVSKKMRLSTGEARLSANKENMGESEWKAECDALEKEVGMLKKKLDEVETILENREGKSNREMVWRLKSYFGMKHGEFVEEEKADSAEEEGEGGVCLIEGESM